MSDMVTGTGTGASLNERVESDAYIPEPDSEREPVLAELISNRSRKRSEVFVIIVL